MITHEDRLLNRMETCITLDKNNPTEMHFKIDLMVKYLHEFGYEVAPNMFEAVIQKAANTYIVGKLPLGDKATIPALAIYILNIAKTMLNNTSINYDIMQSTKDPEIFKDD